MNMTWKHLFSNTILKRGEAYYRNGDVTPKKTAENSNTKTFYVQGTERYIVKIAKGKDAIKRMQCDCPYARSGARCKHMAAALFQMEADGELAMHASTSETNIASNAKAKSNTKSILVSRTKPVEVFPFKQETRTASAEAPYQYYRFDKITAACTFYQTDLETAKKLIEDRRILLEEIYEGFPHYLYRENGRECTAAGVYVDAKGNTHSIRVTFTREELRYTYCSAPACPEGQRRLAH